LRSATRWAADWSRCWQSVPEPVRAVVVIDPAYGSDKAEMQRA
jgi:hypothetical protein